MECAFRRSLDALGDLSAFADRFCTDEKLDPAHAYAVQFGLEEIFTNMVKYNPDAEDDILVRLERDGNELRMSLTESASQPYDVSAVPEARTDLPLEEREPGGLGLHLTRKLVDRIDYDHRDGRNTVTLIKNLE